MLVASEQAVRCGPATRPPQYLLRHRQQTSKYSSGAADRPREKYSGHAQLSLHKLVTEIRSLDSKQLKCLDAKLEKSKKGLLYNSNKIAWC